MNHVAHATTINRRSGPEALLSMGLHFKILYGFPRTFDWWFLLGGAGCVVLILDTDTHKQLPLHFLVYGLTGSPPLARENQ